MTSTEFNIKYKDYIEKGFDGLEFDNTDCTNYLDTLFEELTKIPDFRYSQIKLKFNSVRFYCNKWYLDSTRFETNLEKILKNDT